MNIGNTIVNKTDYRESKILHKKDDVVVYVDVVDDVPTLVKTTVEELLEEWRVI